MHPARKPSTGWLASEARALDGEIAAAEVVIRAIEAARDAASAIQQRPGADTVAWRLVELGIEDVLTEARAEWTALDGRITPEIERQL